MSWLVGDSSWSVGELVLVCQPGRILIYVWLGHGCQGLVALSGACLVASSTLGAAAVALAEQHGEALMLAFFCCLRMASEPGLPRLLHAVLQPAHGNDCEHAA